MQVRISEPRLQRYVRKLVRAGDFASIRETVEAALARMMLDPEPAELDDEALAAIKESQAQIARGEYREFKEVARELRAKYGLRK